MSSSFRLFGQRRFLPLFWVQFFGAANDNVFKNALIVLIIYQNLNLGSLHADALVNLAAGLFILPFFFFSASSGQLTDKLEKSRLIRYIKLLEVIIVLCACVSFAIHSVTLMLLVLFLLGLQATLFGPAKYSYLPQHLQGEELVAGNGFIEMGTFIAILIGTILGGVLIAVPQYGDYYVMICLLVFALAGYGISYTIPVSPANDPSLKLDWHWLRQTFQNINRARHNRSVFYCVLGISWFWFYGAIILTQLPDYVRNAIGGAEHVFTLFLVIFSVGIGIGSVLCAKFSKPERILALVPVGALGMTIFGIVLVACTPSAPASPLLGIDQFFHLPHVVIIVICLAGISVFSGFYTVPLYTRLQQMSEPAYRSRMIAANNIFNALFMVIAAGFAILLIVLHFTTVGIFFVVSLLNLCAILYLLWREPALWQHLRAFISRRSVDGV